MTAWTLVQRNLRFHFRAHLGVVLGAMVGSAALTGALLVGDSVRESLRQLALARLGHIDQAVASGDRFFRAQLATDLGSNAVAVLELPGTASTQDGTARANRVQVLGVSEQFWQLANRAPEIGSIPQDGIVINEALESQLGTKPGEMLLLRIQKPSLLSRDAPLTPQEDFSVALRLKVIRVVSDEELGRFSLQANQISPFNAFVNRELLQEKIGQTNRANLLLAGATSLKTGSGSPANLWNASLREHWQLDDAGLSVRALTPDHVLELRSDRVFLDPPVVEAVQKALGNARPLITYFVNELRCRSNSTPYSMVTAIASPIVPAEMRNDEILINQWLADDLHAAPGDSIQLRYFVAGNGRSLEERTNDFRVRGIVPLAGPTADRTLMPEFPGLAKAESSRDWDAAFPIQFSRIRPKDEQYWKEYRGTPKAFVTLAAGRQMWANRFGEFTALRWSAKNTAPEDLDKRLLANLEPAAVGLDFQPVREQALAASSDATDFGGLFIGFSFFLILAALLLMALLFQFGLERRATEIGTLLALGFRPRQVRLLLLGEGALLALIGGWLGAACGIFYAQAMIRGLTTVWRGAVGTSSLHYHADISTLVIGAVASAAVAAVTIWFTLRHQARRPVRELLALGADLELVSPSPKQTKRNRGPWIGLIAGAFAVALIGFAIARRDTSSADTFFGAGALLLVAGLGFCAAWLGSLAPGKRSSSDVDLPRVSLTELGFRSNARRRKRSLATIGFLACGVFLIVAIGAFRLDAQKDSSQQSSGTGGFALLGEATLPVTYDLNSRAGRDFYGLNPSDLPKVSVVAFRVRDGDDASCLNLNRAQRPRLLGVDPQTLHDRGAFTFAEVAKGADSKKDWLLLKQPNNAGADSADEIPAIADENSILWSLGKKIGDAVDYVDAEGRPFKLRLVGALANSILQGNLIIDESEFVRRFPDVSGYRLFLVDTPSDKASEVSATLTKALQDAGLELTRTTDRLNAFNAVQNTYLSTFQALGGLGLLLGSVGLGIVVLRNIQERRGELALLLAVGFQRRTLKWLVLTEHAALLAAGLGVGVMAALIGILPSVLNPGSQVPYSSLMLTVAGVFANGLVWAWLATWFALRGKLLDALRNS